MIKTIMLILLLIINVLLVFCVGAYIWLRWYIAKHKNDPLTKEEWKILE